MRLLATLGLAAALAGFGSARADAPSPPTVPPAALARALSLEAGDVRLAAGMSFQGLWTAATPPFKQAAAILAPKSPTEARLWTDFFAHAIEVRWVQGDRALTGWRDPLTDVWVLGDWSRDHDAWRLDHVTMALTQDLSGQFPAGAPLQPVFPSKQDGLSRSVLLAQVQAATALRHAAAADAINWDANAPTAQRARDVALLRLGAAEDSLTAMSHVVPTAPHLIRVALVEETPMAPGVSTSVAERLHARSVETRLSLQPIQCLPGNGEALAIVQSALEPQWLFITHLAPTDHAGGVKVANVEAIDLTKAEPAP